MSKKTPREWANGFRGVIDPYNLMRLEDAFAECMEQARDLAVALERELVINSNLRDNQCHMQGHLAKAEEEIARLTAEVERLRDNIEADRAVRSLARMNDEAKIARLEAALREIVTGKTSLIVAVSIARTALAPASEAGNCHHASSVVRPCPDCAATKEGK